MYRITEKRYKDGKKIQLSYDAVGNVTTKVRIKNGVASTTVYTYNDQDQLQQVKEDGIPVATWRRTFSVPRKSVYQFVVLKEDHE